MLAGRKLLLADDSVTIQKVIELTFADEGVRVVTLGNGLDAINQLEEIAPDIVLADVFMPEKSGYEVCEYVKQNEKLKHVPVVLLVGSFEPFDEAEARRVGADDILTKPFQSIRRLIDRVGALVSSPPRSAEAEIPTAELPKTPANGEDMDRLSTNELALSTADTMPLPDELKETLDFGQPVTAKLEEPEVIKETEIAAVSEEELMESSDALLDLGDFEPVHAVAEDDFVLDLDMPGGVSLEDSLGGHNSAPMRAFVEPQLTEAVATAPSFSYQPEVSAPVSSYVEPLAYEDQVHEIVPIGQPIYEPVQLAPEPEPLASSIAPAIAEVAPGELSQEMIDKIARRAVEMLSDKVIREIAWEVVPDLAELLIKRHLEDKESQPR